MPLFYNYASWIQVLVKEEWVALSMLRFAETEKCIIEGAGATGLAAILSGQLPELKGKKWVQFCENIDFVSIA